MTWQIIRSVQQVQVGARRDYQVIRSPSGPRGLAAAQDFGWVLSGVLGGGEMLNSPPFPHAATIVAIYAHSDSGFAAPQTLTVHQKRAGSVIATATLAVGPGATDWAATITALNFGVADIAQLVLPSSADAQCTDLSISLGSTP